MSLKVPCVYPLQLLDYLLQRVCMNSLCCILIFFCVATQPQTSSSTPSKSEYRLIIILSAVSGFLLCIVLSSLSVFLIKKYTHRVQYVSIQDPYGSGKSDRDVNVYV